MGGIDVREVGKTGQHDSSGALSGGCTRIARSFVGILGVVVLS